MTDLTIVGIALLGFATIGGSLVLTEKIRAKAQTDRDRIEERYDRKIQDLKREADAWRLAFEEARVENVQLKSRLDIQNMVFGKVKVKDIKKGE